MTRSQLNVRLAPQDDAEINRWAAELNLERGTLGKQIIAEGLAARREKRAMFKPTASPTPADLQHLTTEVRSIMVELNRVLRQNAKRDAQLVQTAKMDGIGVSEARTAIITQLTKALQMLADSVLTRIAAMPTEQVAAFTASPVMVDIAAAQKRIEQHPSFEEMRTLQATHTKTLRTLDDTINRLIEQPRTVIRLLIWDRDWSPGKVAAGLAFAWLLCIGSYHGLARMLPVSWLAARSSELQTGKGERAVCALLNYRYSTTDCTTRFNGDSMQVTVVQHAPGSRR